jgi:hypothetical protein
VGGGPGSSSSAGGGGTGGGNGGGNGVHLPVICPAGTSTGPVNLGVYDRSSRRFYFRDSNGMPKMVDDSTVLPQSSLLPVAGNWSGTNDLPGLFDPITTEWYLRTGVASGGYQTPFPYGGGLGGGSSPLGGIFGAGSSAGVGVDNAASFRLRKTADPGAPTFTFSFGQPGDVAVVGNWNGAADGVRTPGVYRSGPPALFIFTDANSNSGNPTTCDLPEDVTPALLPVAGAWVPGRTEYFGLFDPALKLFYLRTVNSQHASESDYLCVGDFLQGVNGDLLPLAGRFGL